MVWEKPSFSVWEKRNFLFLSPTKNQYPFLNLESSTLQKVWAQQPIPSFTFLESAAVFVGGTESVAFPVESAKGQLLNYVQSSTRKKVMAYLELFQRSGSAGIKNSFLPAPVAYKNTNVGNQVTFSMFLFTYTRHVCQKIVFKSTLSMQMK